MIQSVLYKINVISDAEARQGDDVVRETVVQRSSGRQLFQGRQGDGRPDENLKRQAQRPSTSCFGMISSIGVSASSCCFTCIKVTALYLFIYLPVVYLFIYFTQLIMSIDNSNNNKLRSTEKE